MGSNPTPASRKAPFVLLNEGERFFVFQGFARFGRNGAQRASHTSVYTESYTFVYTLSYTFQAREPASHADCESAARTALHPVALHRRVREFREILQARKAQQQGNEVYVFPDMACQYKRAGGLVSMAFLAELRALGIKTHAELTTPLQGRRRRVAIKCFHSIRHTVVSFARSCKEFTADMVRDTVGHDSEEIEREYFSAEEESKRAVLEAVAACITPATDSRATA